MGKPYDFSGWATRANTLCSDGRTILRDAFKDCDGATVPLIWNHTYSGPDNVLGHALLKNMEEGVYAYASFNDTEAAKNAKKAVEHGDICALSIFANNLQQRGKDVVHGTIREVSLVLAGANPGALIMDVISHGEPTGDSAYIYNEMETLSLEHGELEDEQPAEQSEAAESAEPNEFQHAESGSEQTAESENSNESSDNSENETLADIYASMTDKQKDAVCAMIAKAVESPEEGSEESTTDNKEENDMKHNVFDQQQDAATTKKTLTHSEMAAIIGDAKRFGSMKESFLQHAQEYGVDQIDYLLPDPKAQTTTPTFIQRDTSWVSDVMGSIHRTPFSRIKSIFADITEDEARAKGYLKGKLKKEEVFGLLKRTTQPTTVYKKQKMDRDDVIDITGFDVIAWLKSEMRMMLDEELARALLLGDGRLASSDDKINEQCIRPVFKDEELFTIKTVITVPSAATEDDKAKAFIRAAIKSRKDYKGSGSPALYTTEDFLADMLLLTDANGRDLYDSVDQLAKKLRVSRIVTVPVMEGVTDTEGNALAGIIVNLADYQIGADKGGAINMFEDFDIDYNQQKYLIETRCSGALTKPHSAIALTFKVSG